MKIDMSLFVFKIDDVQKISRLNTSDFKGLVISWKACKEK